MYEPLSRGFLLNRGFCCHNDCKNCPYKNKNIKIKNMKKLYKFYWDCGRQGYISSRFVATEDEVKKSLGKKIYYGEILGKHSEIWGHLEEKDLVILTDDQDFIEKFEKYIGKSTGHNPLEYIDEENEE